MGAAARSDAAFGPAAAAFRRGYLDKAHHRSPSGFSKAVAPRPRSTMSQL